MADIIISTAKFRKITFLITLACLMAVFVSGFSTVFAKVSDTKRLSNIKEISKALDIYHDKYGVYPDSVDDWNEFDLSFNYKGKLGFLEVLKNEKILVSDVLDPINNEFFHYRYAKYKAGEFGCNSSFYILQVTNFELASTKNGKGECPEIDFTKELPNGYTIQEFD